MSAADQPVALVVGATGIAGSAVIDRCAQLGWTVYGLSRRVPTDAAGYHSIQADLLDRDGLRQALAGVAPTHVFFTSWTRQPTERENREVNTATMRNLFAALRPAGSVRHAALMTGLKHYLGPFEAYGQGPIPDTPFHEDEPRLPVENFYYDQEDELFAAAAAGGFTWSVHRSHTVIGHTVGNAMNMALTVAAAASICRATGAPLVFPGSRTQWDGLTDLTDADLLARQMIWASSTREAADRAYNIANGDTFRWRWMWPRVAAWFGVPWEGFQGDIRPLETQMADAAPIWTQLVRDHDLVEPDLGRVASWWHTDGDLGRTMECLTDMANSRRAGFLDAMPSEDSLILAFDRYRRARIIP